MARAGPVSFLSFFQAFAISEIMSSPNAAESSSTKAEKETEFKGQSRVLKKCHWCAKKQDPGEEPFKACGQCKEVRSIVKYAIHGCIEVTNRLSTAYVASSSLWCPLSSFIALAVAGMSASELAVSQGLVSSSRTSGETLTSRPDRLPNQP